MSSRFADIPCEFDYDKIYETFANDPNPKKIDLIDGVYKDENGQPWVLPVVRQVEQKLASDDTLNHEYLPPFGLEAFSKMALRLLFGADNPILQEQRVLSIQSISGTGALRVGAEFLAKVCKYQVIYCSQQTWEPHNLIIENAGFQVAKKYTYWNQKHRCLNFDGLVKDLKMAAKNSVILFHVVGHNPTVSDPTQKQWEIIADVCQERDLFPFFDFAYQGFVAGDIDMDAWVIRYFASRNFEMLIAQSFAKNFGLYDVRIGQLVVVTKTKSVIPRIKSNLQMLIYGMYMCPPSHGARIILTILKDPELTAQWKESVSIMANRIKEIRTLFVNTLKQMNTPGNWDYLKSQTGMFAYTGLTKRQIRYMIEKYHVYISWNGRINICGMNKKNVQYVVGAIRDSILKYPDHDQRIKSKF